MAKPKALKSDQPRIISICQVQNCNVDLMTLKEYYRRHKICDVHIKMSCLIVGGIPQRFCQQCARFHPLEAFDGDRRTCRERLERHNARRRKGAGGIASDDVPAVHASPLGGANAGKLAYHSTQPSLANTTTDDSSSDNSVLRGQPFMHSCEQHSLPSSATVHNCSDGHHSQDMAFPTGAALYDHSHLHSGYLELSYPSGSQYIQNAISAIGRHSYSQPPPIPEQRIAGDQHTDGSYTPISSSAASKKSTSAGAAPGTLVPVGRLRGTAVEAPPQLQRKPMPRVVSCHPLPTHTHHGDGSPHPVSPNGTWDMTAASDSGNSHHQLHHPSNSNSSMDVYHHQEAPLLSDTERLDDRGSPKANRPLKKVRVVGDAGGGHDSDVEIVSSGGQVAGGGDRDDGEGLVGGGQVPRLRIKTRVSPRIGQAAAAGGSEEKQLEGGQDRKISPFGQLPPSVELAQFPRVAARPPSQISEELSRMQQREKEEQWERDQRRAEVEGEDLRSIPPTTQPVYLVATEHGYQPLKRMEGSDCFTAVSHPSAPGLRGPFHTAAAYPVLRGDTHCIRPQILGKPALKSSPPSPGTPSYVSSQRPSERSPASPSATKPLHVLSGPQPRHVLAPSNKPFEPALLPKPSHGAPVAVPFPHSLGAPVTQQLLPQTVYIDPANPTPQSNPAPGLQLANIVPCYYIQSCGLIVQEGRTLGLVQTADTSSYVVPAAAWQPPCQPQHSQAQAQTWQPASLCQPLATSHPLTWPAATAPV